MAAIHSDEFKWDAVRIALTSGLTRRQVASDLGIGLSTLGKWVRAVSEEVKLPAQDAELLRGSKDVKSQCIAEYRGVLTRSHLCRLMGVSECGLHARKHRQQRNMSRA